MGDIKVGCRVLYKLKYKGTVRFIGSTSFLNGIVIGVELDTPDGKENGTKNGTTYFTCMENYGIFVRQSQLSEIFDEQNVNLEKPLNEDKVDLTEIIKPVVPIAKHVELTKKVVNETDKRRQTFIPGLSQQTNEKENKSTIPRPETRRYTIASKSQINETQIGKENKPNFVKKGLEPIGEQKRSPGNIIEEKNSEIKDLKERLETLTLRRRQDREKLSESKATIDQFNEERKTMIETVKCLKEEKENISCEFNNYRESMKSLEEDIEMASIDKEMAEEKYEEVQMKYQNLEEQYKRIEKENELLRSSEASSSVTTYLDQTAEIEKYKKAIVEMNNFITGLKAAYENKEKEVAKAREQQSAQEDQLIHLTAINVKYENDLKEMKDLVDSTANINIVVDNLTFEIDSLEAELDKSRQTILRFEQLEDKHVRTIEEKNREISTLRDEVECTYNVVILMEDKLAKKNGETDDNNVKNGQLVDTINSLKSQLDSLKKEIELKNDEIVHSREFSRRLTMANYVKQNAAHSDFVRTVEANLLKIELDQHRNHIQLLYNYLPSTFCTASGENETISMVLLLDRVMHKVALVIDYVTHQKRFSLTHNDQGGQFESTSVCHRLEFILTIWKTILDQLKTNVNNCGSQVLHRVSLKYQQLTHHESSLDFLIDLMKRECLDVRRNWKEVEESINFFQMFHRDEFYSSLSDCNVKMNGFIAILSKGSQCLNHDLKWIGQLISANVIKNVQLKRIIDKLENISSSVHSKMKNALLIAQHNQIIEFDLDVSTSIDDTIVYLKCVVDTISDLSLDINEDKVSDDDSVVRMCDMFSVHADRVGLPSPKEIVYTLESIDKTAENIVEGLKGGLYDTGKAKNQAIDSISQSANHYRDRWLKLQSLTSEIQMKDEKLQTATRESNIKSEKLTELNLQVHYFKKKLETGREKRDRDMEHLKEKLQALSNCNIERDQSDKISQLEHYVDKLTNDLKDVRKARSISGADDKEGYWNEILNLKDVCHYLRCQLNQLNASRAQKSIAALRPLNVARPGLGLDRENRLDKAQCLWRDTFKTLSTIKIPDLSAKKNVEAFTKQSIKYSILTNEFQVLENEINMDLSAYQQRFRRSSVVAACPVGNLLGRVNVRGSTEEEMSIRNIRINSLCLSKLEKIFM